MREMQLNNYRINQVGLRFAIFLLNEWNFNFETRQRIEVKTDDQIAFKESNTGHFEAQ